jgi:phosphonate transport system substrate-binding protein
MVEGMKKIAVLAFVCTLVGLSSAFAAGSAQSETRPLVMVWYPNESGEELKLVRDEVGKVIEAATGRKVDHKLTTDYAIAIETIVNKNADLGFFGAQGYIQANDKNPKVLPIVVNSGASGTLKDAVYYSWLNVKKGNEGMYSKDGAFAIDSIQGKRFSFVSNSSTSGFKVPSAGIQSYFSKKAAWSKLVQGDLLEGGKDKFFSQVLFGGSHQGSAVNLLMDKADVAAFCDVCVENYVEFVSGTPNRPGAVYKVKQGAAEPFNNLPGAEFVVIMSTPVLNAPMVYNSETVSAETFGKILAALTSDAVAKNEILFAPKGTKNAKLWSAPERFLAVDDGWFQPVRDLSK